MMTAFSLSYIIKPEFCHALVGYLEEEAVKTYTHALRVGLCAAVCWLQRRQPQSSTLFYKTMQCSTAQHSTEIWSTHCRHPVTAQHSTNACVAVGSIPMRLQRVVVVTWSHCSTHAKTAYS